MQVVTNDPVVVHVMGTLMCCGVYRVPTTEGGIRVSC